MPNWITKIAVPKRIILAWQAPDEHGDRFRWAVGWLEPQLGQLSLRYLQAGPEFETMNSGRGLKEAIALGFHGYPGFAPSIQGHQAGVLEAFMRRLPPRSRPDFAEYKEHFRLAAEADIPDLAMLAFTEAKLPSDGFSIVDPLEGDALDRDLMLEVAGHRYYVKDKPFSGKIGDAVEIIPEPWNPFDPGAVMFAIGGSKIGNINRIQAPAFLRWADRCTISGELERLNGSENKPRAFVFIRVRKALDRAA